MSVDLSTVNKIQVEVPKMTSYSEVFLEEVLSDVTKYEEGQFTMSFHTVSSGVTCLLISHLSVERPMAAAWAVYVVEALSTLDSLAATRRPFVRLLYCPRVI